MAVFKTGKSVDSFLPKFSLTVIFWQLLDSKYNVFKKSPFFLFARNYPSSAFIFSHYDPGRPALCNTCYHGVNDSLAGFLLGQN